ncbi:nuclear transport factor 2 family protein [Nostoc sp.]|uniref:nuclear transport factor 2 family protein n=1 Tax=Nostoc sp. TaxID=1180 RepID=UPI002FF6E631
MENKTMERQTPTQIQQDLLIKAYAAFNARHIDSVLALMHSDVEWANGMEGGYVRGHAAVRDYWTRQWSLIDPHVEPQGFQVDESGRIVVHVHQVVQDLDGNLIHEQMVQHIYTIENGLIRQMDIQAL